MRRVAVVRALHLGDMLCAVPALRSLRAGESGAEITLIGLPWARELAGHIGYVDAFEAFPGFPGIPEHAFDAPTVVRFFRRMHARRFDLAVQLHGSGSHINEFVALLGAETSAVFCRGDDAAPDGSVVVRWPEAGSEIERLLALPRALGCPDTGTALELAIDHGDRVALASVRDAPPDGRPYACVHPGARFATRRWPAERFAAIGDALSARGCEVVLTGTASEAEVTGEVRSRMKAACRDLTGRLSLGSLFALVEGASLVVCNDTGISHVAAATRTPSVVVSSGGDAARWAPLDTGQHPVLWRDVACRPCMHDVCPTGHECARSISVSDVLAQTDRLLQRSAYA